MRKVLFILGQLTDEDVDWLARIGKMEKIKAGETIIQRGKDIENIYIVIEGSLSVFFTSDLSNPAALRYPGEMVGEMSFIDSRPPSATVGSDEGALVLRIPKTLLQGKLDEDKGFAARFYRSTSMLLSDRLRQLAKRLARLEPGVPAEFADVMEDELDPNVLEGVSFAGNRFDRMVKSLRADFES
jgi:CRP-like cAMP-binding protein